MKTAIIVLSDLHINSTVGLCQDVVDLDDGGQYKSSTRQNFLRETYFHFLKFAKDLSKDYEQKVLVLNGDLVDINHKFASHQNITKNTADVVRHAKGILSYAEEIVDKIFVVRGTEAHTGTSGEIEELIAREIGAEYDNENKLYSMWNLQLLINDLLIDFAHHGRIGSKPWNRNAPLYSLATEIMMEGFKNGQEIPDLVIRSHHHTFADTQDALPIRVIQTPCFQLNTAYSHRMGFVNTPDIGGLVILVDESTENNPNYTVEVALYDSPQIQPIKL